MSIILQQKIKKQKTNKQINCGPLYNGADSGPCGQKG